MCARIKQIDGADLEELLEVINSISTEEPEKEYHWHEEAGIGDIVPVNTSSGPELMVWSYKRDDGKAVFNARVDNPIWETAMNENRVILRTSGFIEWKHVGNKATDKFLFTTSDRILNLAGIYVYRNVGGRRTKRLLVHTVDPNESVVNYHNRMPVAVPENEVSAYLNDRKAAREILLRPQPQYMASIMGDQQMRMF